MGVPELDTEEAFDQFVKTKELTVIHFYVPWSQQCTKTNDVLEEMCKVEQYKDAKIAMIEAENMATVSQKFGIAAAPTILLLRNSRVVDRINGFDPTKLNERVTHHLNNKDLSFSDITKPKEPLEDRLKKLINQASCMLFMKGNPEQPRCGFSRTIVSILDGYKADYQTFDILKDQEVREELKKFSNWPTYPQLYINGDLIGGLDIVKEMIESGELESMLPRKDSAKGQ
ncbi:glutaredoxin-3 [Odontomachus brunneus]|uniref:glutaredoxin-3 n=1 Tax=Odontomachus brunneus TaxID=486640 RepID=UPI0013F27AD9|nr:glutaredoxin-3 [Odontomachus brunneus]